MNDIFTFLGGSVIGGFIGYFIKYFLELKTAEKLDEMNRKRKLYEDMIDSLNDVFIDGRNNTKEIENQLLISYERLWLWASDEVVSNASYYLKQQIRYSHNPNSLSQDELKKSFVDIIIAMRKDLVGKATYVSNEEYQFLKFSKNK